MSMLKGTNDYNQSKLIPAETIVSRTLQAKNRNFTNVIWRSGKPALDSEWNLINDLSAEWLTKYTRSQVNSGWLDIGDIIDYTDSQKLANELSDKFRINSTKKVIEIDVPNVVVNGMPLIVGGTNYIDTSINQINLSPVGSTARYDLVFLEVFKAEIRSRDTNNNKIAYNKPSTTELWGYGNVNLGIISNVGTISKPTGGSIVTFTNKISSNIVANDKLTVNGIDYLISSRDSDFQVTLQNSVTEMWSVTKFMIRSKDVSFPDDIVDSIIQPSTDGLETSQRVQLQYRIRVVDNVDHPNSFSDGFENVIVQGQGASVNPQVTGYTFTNMKSILGDAGLWRAGNGDEASRTALNSVDGYTYAIPMFKVYRRANIIWSDSGASQLIAETNQSGNSKKLIDLISDRPDLKFNDSIYLSDIIDLRRKIAYDLDLESILEKNIDALLKNENNSTKQKTLQYDSIANSDVFGYTDVLSNLGCGGKRTLWSDAASTQTDILAQIDPTAIIDNSKDVYRGSGSGNWEVGDTIIIQTANQQLPLGTQINNVRVYWEDKTFPNSGSVVDCSLSATPSNQVTITLINVVPVAFELKRIWIIYDLNLSAGQGTSFVAEELVRVSYENAASFPIANSNLPNGTVVRGKVQDVILRDFTKNYNHPYNNLDSTGTILGNISEVKQRKQFKLTPLVQTTTTKDGGTRTFQVKTLNATEGKIIVPYKIQHLKGIYTQATGGTEVATRTFSNLLVDSANNTTDNYVKMVTNYVCELTSLQYDPNGAFTGGQTELLSIAGGQYSPVYQHLQFGNSNPGTIIRLYNTITGIQYILPDNVSLHYRYSGRRIKVSTSVGSEGYNINNMIINCTNSDQYATLGPLGDDAALWIDMDYYAPVHKGAEIRLCYEHSPYQGADIGNQNIELMYKRSKGLFFNNGTGGGDISTSSNLYYTPISTKLPGVFDDHLKDGDEVLVSGIGTKYSVTDAYFGVNYDLYAKGMLWNKNSIILPALPETTSRGFTADPLVETIFELPVIDQTYAQFVLFSIIKDKNTDELFMYVQIKKENTNKSAHIKGDGTYFVEIYKLKERILIK